MGRGRVYTDEEKAAALAALKANKGNVSKTAREVGVPMQTLHEWTRRHSELPTEVPISRSEPEKKEVKVLSAERVAAILPAMEREMAGTFWEACKKHLGRAGDPEAIAKLAADRAAISACALADKARLLSGGSTSNVEHHVRVEEYSRLPLAERIRLLREEAASPPASGEQEGVQPGNLNVQ
jgi:transposase-like protein